MSKDLSVNVFVENHCAVFPGRADYWCVYVTSPLKMKNGAHKLDDTTCVGSGYKSRRGAIKAAKRLLPLFVNAVLEK